MREQADSAESPKQGESSASLKPHNQHSQPQRNQSHHLPTQNRNPELGPDSHQDKLRPNSLTHCYTSLVPSSSLEGEAEEREQQPRADGTATSRRWPVSDTQEQLLPNPPGLFSCSLHPKVLTHCWPELLSPGDEIFLQASQGRRESQ